MTKLTRWWNGTRYLNYSLPQNVILVWGLLFFSSQTNSHRPIPLWYFQSFDERSDPRVPENSIVIRACLALYTEIEIILNWINNILTGRYASDFFELLYERYISIHLYQYFTRSNGQYLRLFLCWSIDLQRESHLTFRSSEFFYPLLFLSGSRQV